MTSARTKRILSGLVELAGVTRGQCPSVRRGRLRRVFRRASCTEGSALVEMAISSVIFLSILFGIVEFSMALYTYNYVSDAAREATRYAMVRGSTSCTNTPGLSPCGTSQTGATATDISNYVKGLGFPGIDATNRTTVTTTWYTPPASGSTTWTQCTTGTCNQPGYAVDVQVAYRFPLSIPFWRATTLNLSATSRMVISQ